MKKFYIILLTAIAGGIISYFLFFTGNENNQLAQFFTPSEFYEYEIQQKKLKSESKADKPDEFTRYFKEITTRFGEDENSYPMNYKIKELNSAKAKSSKLKLGTNDIVFVQRGPANVGGRTRGLIVDPDDQTHNTWYAGAATGGVWKTTDGGHNWTCLTDEFPNLSANTLAMAASNTQVIYAGTGESFPGGTYLEGNGIFKTTDKGESWTQLASTTNNDYFAYINRLVVDPNNENIVIAATEEGIMKSTDGGLQWDTVYTNANGVEDLVTNPNDFNILYAGVNSYGILKSNDAGENWTISFDELIAGQRYELAVSPVDPNIIYISINVSTTESYVYRSTDAGETWFKFEDKNGNNKNYMGGQGEYDNIIEAHPYNKDIAFVGGVDLWKVDFSDPGTVEESEPSVKSVSLDNTSSFLAFINFEGEFLDGGMELGTNNGATNLDNDDFVSIEIRFGPGLSQKAHRFTVGGLGPEVPASGYYYEDYVDVPFEVWDITNNKQLMASFRDQEEDGAFNLIALDPEDDTKGREYLFINSVEYSETASPQIAQDAGHSYKQIYFFWPTLATGGTWDPNNLPQSKISVIYGTTQLQKGTNYIVADAYGQYGGDNNYNQSVGMGTTKIPGLHPDHHNLIMVPINEATDSFLIVNANDGGLGISFDSGETFNQLPDNYITTQFYGAAKKPYTNEYIGGMQDNGTWRTQTGDNSSSSSHYLFQLGGDGFECMWHYNDKNKIIGSIYNNAFYRTLNGGVTWSLATNGITSNDGPFISRISSHPSTPDVLFAVGAESIYKSTNFAESWISKTMPEGWNPYASQGYVPSQLNVEVSLANENIVWAGAAMSGANGWKIFVSDDQGETFSAVNEFTEVEMNAFISGIATHPYQDSTAYILFSVADAPKILKTEDLGQTWEDITGFVGNETSSNGFPDVVTQSLLVLPDEPNTIWAGTDIGLFESKDNGTTWHYANYGLPAVSVYDMFYQDDQVVIATHGRGIWTAKSKYLPEINTTKYIGQQTISSSYILFADADSVEFFVDDVLTDKIGLTTAGSNVFNFQVENEGEYEVKLISYHNGNSYESNNSLAIADFNPKLNKLFKPEDIDNTISIDATIQENYDSIQIDLNNVVHKTITDFTIGNNIFNTEINESRTYRVKIIGYINDTGYESGSEYINMTYVGINEFIGVETLKVYPNPTKGNISIEIPEHINVQTNIDVYSLSGVNVFSSKISKDDNRINLNHLNNGIYIIRIIYDGKVYSNKIQLRK
ncbi:MAG: T9SS type A sorting domain-containing protein [Bacteroidota bacterium]|nr:T9SS type A sorting domain-containing protein [Bacteroidota bacterium]